MANVHSDNLGEVLRLIINSYMDSGLVSKAETENTLEDIIQYIERKKLELSEEDNKVRWK